MVVPDKPSRRTYKTGGTLPALTDEFRPIPLGRDSVGDVDAQIRALAVLIRNRADTPIYVKEGPDASDSFEISPGEQYKIWEPNGVSNLNLRGTNGGETAEIRTLEAHNDFDLTDRIEAFARSLAHFVGTATANTTITGQDVDLTIDDAGGINVAGTVDVGQFSDTVTIDDIQAGTVNADVSGTVDVGQFSDTVTIDDIQAGTVSIGDITGQTTNLTVDGTVDVDQIADSIDVGTISAITDSITIDDITATSAPFDGDITGQTNFDLTAHTRKGQTNVVSHDGTYSVGTFNSTLSTVIADYYNYRSHDPATYDGRLERLEVRVFDFSSADKVGIKFKIDYGNTGNWETVSPRAMYRGDMAYRLGNRTVETPTYFPNGEVVFVWEPVNPPTWEAGDSVGVEVGPHGTTAGTGSYSIEIEQITTEYVTD